VEIQRMRRSFSKHYPQDCAKNESINACCQLHTCHIVQCCH